MLEKPKVSWDWYVDEYGPAFGVLGEFRHFGLMSHWTECDYDYPEGTHNLPNIYLSSLGGVSAMCGRWFGIG